MNKSIPQPLFTGPHGACHIQGICVDEEKGFVYYSFTTKLVKARLDGTIVGCIDGLMGHLGCIAFNKADGFIYGSLEYKNDAIGQGILNKLSSKAKFEDGFYVVRFDPDRIDGMDLSADSSDIMTAVYIGEAVKDYNGEGKNKRGERVPHALGCSGIDGTTFAPLPGKKTEDGTYLYVAYGVYGDPEREDNDHQVLLCYDVKDWDKVARPLNQSQMHKNELPHLLHKFFVYTGNTTYGVQNLEYDPASNATFMAVYKGKKPSFPNLPLYAVDWSVPAKKEVLCGLGYEGEVLTLKEGPVKGEKGVSGWNFMHGNTGLFSFGDGRWLVCEKKKSTLGQCGYIYSYRYDGETPFLLEL